MDFNKSFEDLDKSIQEVDGLVKSIKNKSQLVAVKKTVKRKDGKTHTQTFYVSPEQAKEMKKDKSHVEHPGNKKHDYPVGKKIYMVGFKNGYEVEYNANSKEHAIEEFKRMRPDHAQYASKYGEIEARLHETDVPESRIRLNTKNVKVNPPNTPDLSGRYPAAKEESSQYDDSKMSDDELQAEIRFNQYVIDDMDKDIAEYQERLSILRERIGKILDKNYTNWPKMMRSTYYGYLGDERRTTQKIATLKRYVEEKTKVIRELKRKQVSDEELMNNIRSFRRNKSQEIDEKYEPELRQLKFDADSYKQIWDNIDAKKITGEEREKAVNNYFAAKNRLTSKEQEKSKELEQAVDDHPDAVELTKRNYAKRTDDDLREVIQEAKSQVRIPFKREIGSIQAQVDRNEEDIRQISNRIVQLTDISQQDERQSLMEKVNQLNDENEILKDKIFSTNSQMKKEEAKIDKEHLASQELKKRTEQPTNRKKVDNDTRKKELSEKLYDLELIMDYMNMYSKRDNPELVEKAKKEKDKLAQIHSETLNEREQIGKQKPVGELTFNQYFEQLLDNNPYKTDYLKKENKDILENMKNEAKKEYLKDLREHAKTQKLSNNAIQSVIKLFGKKTLFSEFRGVSGYGLEESDWYKNANKRDTTDKKSKSEPTSTDNKPSENKPILGTGQPMAKDAARDAIGALRTKIGTNGVIELALKNGIQWKRNFEFPSNDYMQAAMAINKHLRNGGVIKEEEQRKFNELNGLEQQTANNEATEKMNRYIDKHGEDSFIKQVFKLTGKNAKNESEARKIMKQHVLLDNVTFPEQPNYKNMNKEELQAEITSAKKAIEKETNYQVKNAQDSVDFKERKLKELKERKQTPSIIERVERLEEDIKEWKQITKERAKRGENKLVNIDASHPASIELRSQN